MTQKILDIQEIKEELVVFLRNQGILSTSVRGVTNTQDTGTFSSDSSYLINRTNVKNIKSVTIASTSKSFGTDYTVDYYFDDSGTRKCKISFVSSETGAYTIDYDYGTDKIWPDFPRDDLSISSYPRIAVDVISITTQPFGIGGNEDLSNILFSVQVFGTSTSDLNTYQKSIRTKFLENRKTFFNLGFITPVGTGPLIDDAKRQEIMSQNFDFQSIINLETVA